MPRALHAMHHFAGFGDFKAFRNDFSCLHLWHMALLYSVSMVLRNDAIINE